MLVVAKAERLFVTGIQGACVAVDLAGTAVIPPRV